MDNHEYSIAALRTAGGSVHPLVCDPALIVEALDNFANGGEADDLSAVKKGYFYGKNTQTLLALHSRLQGESADLTPFVDDGVLHGIIGIGTEATELASLVVESYHEGIPVNRHDVIDECGDILWYVNRALVAAGSSIGEAMAKNIAKLRARFPNQFSLEAWEARDKGAELAVQQLEGSEPVGLLTPIPGFDLPQAKFNVNQVTENCSSLADLAMTLRDVADRLDADDKAGWFIVDRAGDGDVWAEKVLQ